jgi:hypothetical protein
MSNYDNLRSLAQTWVADRPTMDENNTVPNLLNLLKTEVQEAIDSSPEELHQELADIGIFLFAIMEKLNLDLHDEMVEKHAYNTLRYHWQDFQDGDYEEGRKKAKAREPELKKEFYSIPK